MPRSEEKIAAQVTREQQARAREARVLELRKSGATFARIAGVVGYADASNAKRAYDRAMKATIQQPADELRALEEERLDSLLLAMWPAAMQGKGYAVEKCLMIMDRRARLLGLDAPARTHLTVTDEMSVEIERLAAELGADVGV